MSGHHLWNPAAKTHKAERSDNAERLDMSSLGADMSGQSL
jgi:hypothetical protein